LEDRVKPKIVKTGRITRSSIELAIIFVLIAGCGTAPEPSITPEEARTLAKDAYVYGFPMVMNYKTLYTYTIDESSPEYRGPLNEIACEARLFTPEDRAIVTPNADTPYCMFWVDLRAEPMVLSGPEMEPERFYHFQFVDLYTHNFAYVGTLQTGNGAGTFLVTGPNWDGRKPEGVSDVIRSETGLAFVITRTQLFDTEDLERVQEIQSEYELKPLSTFLGTDSPPAQASVSFPKWVEGVQFDERFFGFLDLMMSLLERPGAGEEQLWAQLARLGIGPGNTFDFAALTPEVQAALRDGVKDGLSAIEKFVTEHVSDPLVSAKILGTREFLTESAKANYGLDDLSILRSVAAHRGLFGNSAAEAIYPTYITDGEQQPLDGSANGYTLTFEEGSFPPVRAFWSLTMYDGKTQLFIDNPLDRYLLNSTMMDQFQMARDGSLTVYIQKDSPGKANESNWLPAPDGPFYMVMRLYGPEAEALEGVWSPPGLVRTR
jgi:hypothetical protein